MKKYRVFIAVVLAVALAIPVFAASVMTIDVEPDVKVYVDDMPIDAGETHGNPEAFIYNGTTYIAAKGVSLSLGENVKWDGSTRSVYIGKHEGSSYFLLDVCPPYDGEVYREDNTVNMSGKTYFSSLTFGFQGFALFNLNGKYDTLSFDVGHIDGARMNSETFTIYLDGERVFTVEVAPESMPEHYEIPLNGALQMKIESDNTSLDYASKAALANIRVS